VVLRFGRWEPERRSHKSRIRGGAHPPQTGGCRNAGVALSFVLGPWYAGDDNFGPSGSPYRLWPLVSTRARQSRWRRALCSDGKCVCAGAQNARNKGRSEWRARGNRRIPECRKQLGLPIAVTGGHRFWLACAYPHTYVKCGNARPSAVMDSSHREYLCYTYPLTAFLEPSC